MAAEWDQRIGALVDREAFNNDAQYHATISSFRNWCRITKLAMEDEGITPYLVQRVLDRIVYGTPSGADAHLRIADLQERLRQTLRGL